MSHTGGKLTVSEAATFAGVSVQTVRNWASMGKVRTNIDTRATGKRGDPKIYVDERSLLVTTINDLRRRVNELESRVNI